MKTDAQSAGWMTAVGIDSAGPGRSITGFVSMLAGRLLAGALLVLSLPVFLVLRVVFRLVEGPGPFLYCGERIGRHGRRFNMYKIRTLALGAEHSLAGVLYRQGSGLELRMGRFLRASRLDELPQLFNVMRGDMRFIGPRPERPSVYERECRRLRGYDRRFQVSPGLTGLSQFLTPHSSPKSLRVRIDNLLLRHESDPLWKLRLVLWTAGAIARNAVAEAANAAADTLVAFAAGRGRRRGFRIASPAIRVFEAEEGWRPAAEWRVTDISDHAIRVVPDRPLQGGTLVRLVVRASVGRRRRTIRYQGVVQQVRAGRNTGCPEAVIGFEPASTFHRYLSDSYVFRQTIAWPRHFCALALLGRRVAAAFASRFGAFRHTAGLDGAQAGQTDGHKAARVAIRSGPVILSARLTRSGIEALMRRKTNGRPAGTTAGQTTEEQGAVR